MITERLTTRPWIAKATARRAPLDAVTASRTIVCEEDGLRAAGHYDSAFTQKTYVHASNDDLQQGRAALAKIHKIA
jgi:hypothetical protein